MRISRVHVTNYKGLRDVELPLSQFACLIGENNTGKSSVLQAVALFFSGTALSSINYFDDSCEIRIELTLADIDEADLNRLGDEHRSRISEIIRNGALILVRIYGTEGKSTLKYRRLVPEDPRFSAESITALVKGKKVGNVVAKFPELDGVVTSAMNQTEIKAKILELGDSLPDQTKVLADVDLPTGIDKSIYAMLPVPIYIPAVKDLKDDVKTSESTPFGKVLGILLKAIEPQLAEEKSLFEQLNSKLNRVVDPDGRVKDDRLAPVKEIESTVERFVQESFKTVSLRITIPPPELKTVLSSAVIYADDGVEGPIETKGDGLRRAIVFAILRAYVELSKRGLVAEGPTEKTPTPRYLLLFEEPELYLHPQAQQLLFDALGVFAEKHPVVVTTHSPLFFGPQSTTVFIKMQKKLDHSVAPKPFGTSRHIDLGDTSARDQFQIICYENNNIAFFAEAVVLVEGDSDYIVVPHLARIINPMWDSGQVPIRFVRMGGKSNIGRYRNFFRRFGSRVFVLTDLDFLLGNEFSQIDPSKDLTSDRSRLLAELDRLIEASGGTPEPNSEKLKEAHDKRDLRALWRRARQLQDQYKEGNATREQVAVAVDEFFSWEKSWARREFLMKCPTPELLAQKRAFLEKLRTNGVWVLEKGAIDDYYPKGVTGDGKTAKAQTFCNMIKTRDEALRLCGDGQHGCGGTPESEFELMFRAFFEAGSADIRI